MNQYEVDKAKVEDLSRNSSDKNEEKMSSPRVNLRDLLNESGPSFSRNTEKTPQDKKCIHLFGKPSTNSPKSMTKSNITQPILFLDMPTSSLENKDILSLNQISSGSNITQKVPINNGSHSIKELRGREEKKVDSIGAVKSQTNMNIKIKEEPEHEEAPEQKVEPALEINLSLKMNQYEVDKAKVEDLSKNSSDKNEEKMPSPKVSLRNFLNESGPSFSRNTEKKPSRQKRYSTKWKTIYQ